MTERNRILQCRVQEEKAEQVKTERDKRSMAKQKARERAPFGKGRLVAEQEVP